MSEATLNSPLGDAWTRLCVWDGAISATASFADSDLAPGNRSRLHSIYTDLRLKGLLPEVIARIDPVKLMEKDDETISDTLEAMPQVEPMPTEEEMEAELNAEMMGEDIVLDPQMLGLVPPPSPH